MASLIKLKTGAYRITITRGEKQHCIHLGAVNKKAAELALSMIEQAESYNAMGAAYPVELSTWIAKIKDDLHGKLVSAGVLAERHRHTLGQFIETFTSSKKWKTKTTEVFRKTAELITDFFGEDTQIERISANDAADFRGMLVKKGYAEASVAKHIGGAKAIFNDAVSRDLLTRSPFEKVHRGSQVNTERQHYITVVEYYTLRNSCKDARQRLILALWRFGGLRAESELLGLKWSDIENWSISDIPNRRFMVYSPKTENKGKNKRYIRMFPELERAFREYYDLLPEGCSDFVFSNLKPYDRIFISKVADKCGLGHIPKIPQNCRSSIGTQLLDEGWTPARVAKFLGNTVPVLLKHYYQMRGCEYGDGNQSDISVEQVQDFTQEHAGRDMKGIENGNSLVEGKTAQTIDNSRTCNVFHNTSYYSEDDVKPPELSSAGLEPVTFGFGDRRKTYILSGHFTT